ncbi:MAG: hypothetical protein PHV68_08400 [Candidatus Gastranaerophilales bacterium]|nr:hypothetical protein [Candidatus Gastranaerophilales bacterium]
MHEDKKKILKGFKEFTKNEGIKPKTADKNLLLNKVREHATKISLENSQKTKNPYIKIPVAFYQV